MYTVCDMYIPNNVEIFDIMFKQSGNNSPIENGRIVRVQEGDNYDLGVGRYPNQNDPISELALVYSPEYPPAYHKHCYSYDEFRNEAGMVSRVIRLKRGMKFYLSADGFNFDPATVPNGTLVCVDSNGKFSLCDVGEVKLVVGRMREWRYKKGKQMYSVAIIDDGNTNEVDYELSFHEITKQVLQ